MTPNWRQQSMYCRVELSFRGLLTSWRTRFDWSLIKYKYKPPDLGRNKPIQHCSLRADNLKSSFVQKDLKVQAGNKLNMIQKSALAAMKQGCVKRYNQKEKGIDYFPLVSTCRSIFDMLCPILGSPVRQQPGQTGGNKVAGRWGRGGI